MGYVLIHISSGMTSIFFVLRVSIVPPGSEYDEEEVDYEESDSDESWTTESAISSESILSSMCMNGGEEKPFACPVPGCKKRYKVRLHQLVPATQSQDTRFSSFHTGAFVWVSHVWAQYLKITEILDVVIGSSIWYIMVYLLWLNFITAGNKNLIQLVGPALWLTDIVGTLLSYPPFRPKQWFRGKKAIFVFDFIWHVNSRVNSGGIPFSVLLWFDVGVKMISFDIKWQRGFL